MCKSYSDSQRHFRHLITLLSTFQGWLVGGEKWCYQNLSDGNQEARLQHPIAIVLVKCLTGYETKVMQRWESGPAGSDEVHWTRRESHPLSLVKGKTSPAHFRNKTLQIECLGRAEVIWSLALCIIPWKTWYTSRSEASWEIYGSTLCCNFEWLNIMLKWQLHILYI